MPVWEDENHTYEDLKELKKWNVCAECLGSLALFMDPESGVTFLVCNDYYRTFHEGIIREASPYQKEGLQSLTLDERRKIVTSQIGEEKTTALDKYIGVTSLTRDQAKEILTTIWPKAPGNEITKAMILCASYGLNPLMGHVFLIPFKDKWATVMGIKANRLIASRKGTISYIDDTPRLMTEAEQVKIFGKKQTGQICAITKIKDPDTGAEASGYGRWPEKESPYGMDKGNSPENMSFIRSERQALDRLRPGEMPVGVEVMDERYMPAPEEKAPEGVVEAEAKVVEPEPKAEKPAPKKSSPPKAKATQPAPKAEGEYTAEQLLAWVCDVRTFSSHETARKFLIEKCEVSNEDIDNKPAKVYEEIKDLIS